MNEFRLPKDAFVPDSMPVISNEFIPKTAPVKTGRVLWPEDRFVEYESADAAWGVPLGLATEETREERVFYVMDTRRLFDWRMPIQMPMHVPMILSPIW